MSVTTLVLVDVQNDFHPGGSLAIPTADKDAERIAKLIENHAHSIQRVVATMDSHQKLHIAHPGFWLSNEGIHPAPFTIISSQDIVDGKWKPNSTVKVPPGSIDPDVFEGMDQVLADDGISVNLHKYAIEYTKRLEQKGKFKLCIWPERTSMNALYIVFPSMDFMSLTNLIFARIFRLFDWFSRSLHGECCL